jgi:hypothetical protein
MLDDKKTNKYGTMTSEGFVPHLPYEYPAFLPVMLDIDINSVRAIMTHQPPLRIDDNLVFALPGGSVVRSNISEVES